MSGIRIYVLRRGLGRSFAHLRVRRTHHPGVLPRLSKCHAAPSLACSALVPFSSYQKRISPELDYIRLKVSCFSTSGKDEPKTESNKDEESTAPSKRKLMKHWLRQLKSPPNIITTARILFTPALSYLIITEQYGIALCGCFVAGLSDVLDGYLAKRYNMCTVLGTYLDPLADKILINVLSLSMWYADILPTPLMVLWLGRDIGLMAATYLYVRAETKSGGFIVDPGTTPLKVEPTTVSKVNTAFQFLTLLVGLLQPMYDIPPGTLDALW